MVSESRGGKNLRALAPERGRRRRLLRDLILFAASSPLAFLAGRVEAAEESEPFSEESPPPPLVLSEEVLPLTDDLEPDDVPTASVEVVLPERVVWTALPDNLLVVQRALALAHTSPFGYRGLCQTFAEVAYFGHAGVWRTASVAGMAPGVIHGRGWVEAPLGSLVYFSANRGNQFGGHAGIKIAHPDVMLSATYLGVRRDSIAQWSKSQASFVGYRP